MSAVRSVPFRERSRLVNVFEYLPPARRIVSAERDLPLDSSDSGRIHSDNVEVEVEEILEPHARNHQQAPLRIHVVLGVPIRGVASETRQKLLEQAGEVGKAKAGRCPHRIEVPEDGEWEPSLD